MLSDEPCVVAATPSVNTPELDVSPPNNVSLVAISTPSTVPVTVMLPDTSIPPLASKLFGISTLPSVLIFSFVELLVVSVILNVPSSL